MKMINTVDIQAAREKVFYWLEEPERGKQWMKSVTRSEILHETPEKVGTTFREYVEEDGEGLEMEGVITKFDPNEQFAVHLESKLNTVDVCFTLDERDGMTRLAQNINMRFKGWMKVTGFLLSPVIKKKVKRQTENEFSILKKLCEQGE